MAHSTVFQRKDDIFKLLKDDSKKPIILVGDSGVGKTWTARQISGCAIKEGLFEIALWVFLNREYDETTVLESIARQLSLLPIAEEWEAEDGNKAAEQEEEKPEVLQQMISEALAGKRLLLILDDEGNKVDEKQIMSKLETLLNLQHQCSDYRVLITSIKSISSYAPTRTDRVIQIKPLSEVESLSLLRKRVGRRICEVPAIEALAKSFIKKTKYFPAAIILMAKALSYFGLHDSRAQMLKGAWEEASDNESFNLKQLLHIGYDILPKIILIDCCRPGSHFFRDRGGIHYSELIAYWIMEGFLGHVDCIEKAYEEGHSILMELVDCRFLKMLEGGYVIFDRAIINSIDCDRYEFEGPASLGLADVFKDRKRDGLGRVTQTDGSIKSICSGQKGHKLSTLFLDGNHSTEILGNFFASKQDLQVLTLFNPILQSLAQLLSDMHKLRVLVLRGCYFLEKVEHNFELKSLTVLEISNASSLKTIPNEFFDHMPQLRSLHLSQLKIDALPSSLFNLKQLCWLILRECSSFETLNSLKNFSNLLVLDVSGSTSFTKFVDKAFKHTPNLQVLNLSYTNIKKLPMLPRLGELTHFSLSGCRILERLPKTESLSKLQTLDLSCAEKFNEFREQSLGNPGVLKIIDLSETSLETLPSKINPRHLFLKHCLQLKKLPCIESLKVLEVLDLSGSKFLIEIDDKFFDNLSSLQILNLSKTGIKTLPSLFSLSNLCQLLLSGCIDLTVIEDKSFDQMSHLQRLDLSETKIERLPPSLSNLSNLRHLLLKKCTELRDIPALESLSNLEELNLCGISCLRKNGADFLKHMSHLQILDLSETLLEELPPMSNLKSLLELYLRGCQGLKSVPDLESLTELKVLDLSGTGISHLPSLKDFGNLCQLLLRGCSGLKEFQQLEMLDVLGATIKELPYGISELTHLEHLDLPNMKNTQGAGSSKIKEPNQYGWGISILPAETVGDNDKPPVMVSSSQFLQLLENNQLHFSVHPIEEQDRKGVVSFYRDDFVFRGIYFQTRQFSDIEKQGSLQICGFDHLPEGIKDVLCHADSVFFVDIAFGRSLPDLGASYLKELKRCWIERCREMKTVFYEGEAEDIDKLGSLEVLWISNSVNLEHIYCGNRQSDTFRNLMRLYLDCCPKLSFVFSSSQLPKLQVLQIKFCDELEAVFGQASPKPELPNLETLYLWELPKLKSIGCALPALKTLKVWRCPNLVEFKENVNLDRCL